MPSFVVHATIPLLLLLASRRFEARKVWILWPFTFLPDMDYFFGFHRATFTNVFFLAPFVFGWLWLRYGPAHRKEAAEWFLVAVVYLVSHYVMDTFTGGTVLLYPLSDYTFCYTAEIDVATATNTPSFTFEPCGHPGIPQVAPYYSWLPENDGAVLAFLLPAALVIAALRWRAYRRDKGPREAPRSAASEPRER